MQFFKDFHPAKKIADRSKTGTTLVVEEDGGLVATGSLVGGEILAVFVHPRLQKGGRGKAPHESAGKRGPRNRRDGNWTQHLTALKEVLRESRLQEAMIGREERLYINFAGRELPMTFNLLSLPDSERSAVGYVGEPWPAVRHLMEDHRADTGRFARPLPIAQLFRFFVYTSGMSLRTPAEITALRLLDRDGIAAIWGLLAAAAAHRDGRKAVAAAIIEIATAAEQEWLRREGTRMLKG